jgi:hypothetical protein
MPSPLSLFLPNMRFVSRVLQFAFVKRKKKASTESFVNCISEENKLLQLHCISEENELCELYLDK